MRELAADIRHNGGLLFLLALLAVLVPAVQASFAGRGAVMSAISGAWAILGVALYVRIVRQNTARDTPDGSARRRRDAPRAAGTSSRDIAPTELTGSAALPRAVADALIGARGHAREPSDQASLLPEASQRQPDERELRGANHLAVVGRLTAEMAHEFGTPLGVVLARARMIVADDTALDEARRDAEAIIVQVRRMAEMCRTVLDYARPRRPADAPERVDLVRTTQHTLKLLAPEARNRKAKLKLDGPIDPAFVLGEESKLSQILTNLVVNAMESMPCGGQVRIRIERERARPADKVDGVFAEYACVHVQDEGTGIGRADLPQVFDSFFTTKRAEGGSGLGLAISQRLAHEGGGWLAVASTEGRGSCFSLYLPLLEAT